MSKTARSILILSTIFMWLISFAGGCTPDCGTATAGYNAALQSYQNAQAEYSGAVSAFMQTANDPQYGGKNVAQETMNEYSKALGHSFETPPGVAACTEDTATEVEKATSKIEAITRDYQNQASILRRGIQDMMH